MSETGSNALPKDFALEGGEHGQQCGHGLLPLYGAGRVCRTHTVKESLSLLALQLERFRTRNGYRVTPTWVNPPVFYKIR